MKKEGRRACGSVLRGRNRLRLTVAIALLHGCCCVMPGIAEADTNGTPQQISEIDNQTLEYFAAYGSADTTQGYSVTIKNGSSLTLTGDYAYLLAIGVLNSNDGSLLANNTYSSAGGSVSIIDSTVNAKVVAGNAAINGTAQKGSISVSGSSTVNSDLAGGESDYHESNYPSTKPTLSVTRNSVTIAGGTITDPHTNVNDPSHYGIAGGVLDSFIGGSVSDNTVTISGNNTVISSGALSSGAWGVYGGQAKYCGDVGNNLVTISGGTINEPVYGGSSGQYEYIKNGGIVSKPVQSLSKENTVTIKGGTLTGSIYGGFSWNNGQKSIANQNTVNINGGTITPLTLDEHGSQQMGVITGGESGNSAENTIDGAYKNTVNIKGGTVTGIINGGDSDYGTADGNVVNISDGTVTGSIEGGCSKYGKANDNVVNIRAGTVKWDIKGGYSEGGTAANKNQVNISGGKLEEYSMMGPDGTQIMFAQILGGCSQNGSAEENSVNISGGEVPGNIIGGTSKEVPKNNTINISGSAKLAEGTNLVGGDWQSEGILPVAGTGNNLNLGYDGVKGEVSSWGGGRVNMLANFDQVNFKGTIPWKTGSTYLSTTGISNINQFDFSKLTLSAEPAIGESMNLLSVTNGGLTSNMVTVLNKTSARTDSQRKGSVSAVWTGGMHVLSTAVTYDFTTITGITYGNIGTAAANEVIYAPAELHQASGLDFAANTKVDVTNFAADGLANGDSITLLSTKNMADKAAFTSNVTIQGETTHISTTTDTQSGLAMSGTATGTIAKTENAITYTLSKVLIGSIDASAVNWSSGGTAYAIKNGYTFQDGVTLDGSAIGFTNTVNTGQSMTLIDGNANMSDIDEWKKLKLTNTSVKKSLSGDTVSGVTLSGTQAYAYANDTDSRKITAHIGNKEVTGMALGDMSWGSPRVLTSEGLSGLTSIDASRLDFATGQLNWEKLGMSTALVTSTQAGLSGVPVIQSAVNNTIHPAAGVTAVVSGTVAAADARTLQYTLDRISGLSYGDLGTVTAGSVLLAVPAEGAVFAADTSVNTANLAVSGLAYGDRITLLSASGMADKSSFTNHVRLSGDTADTGSITKTTDVSDQQHGLKMAAAATTTIAKTAEAITYTQGNAVISSIDASNVNWTTGGTAFATKAGYTFQSGTTLDQSTIAFASNTASAGEAMTLIDGSLMASGWDNLSLTGRTRPMSFTRDAGSGVTLSGTQSYRYANDTANRRITATLGDKEYTGITLGTMNWGKTASITAENLSGLKSIDASGLTFAAGDVTWPKLGTSTKLVMSAQGGLSGVSIAQPTAVYTVQPLANVSGVTAELFGTAAAADANTLTYTLDGVKSITFGSNLPWTTGGTLLDLSALPVRLADTAVNTANVSFTTDSVKNAIVLDGSYQMTLLKANADSGLSASNLSHAASTFNIGDVLTGTGDASYANGNIVYTIQADSKVKATEQTHQAVVSSSAAVAAVSSNAVDTADTAGTALSSVSNTAAVGDTVNFSKIGGGSHTYDTGSSVTTHLWQVSAGVGARHKQKNGAVFEYAVYYEGGRGSYTTYNEHAASPYGSGRLSYNGGGVFVRYELPNRVYGEASVHAGRMRNEANNFLYDSTGRGYGYDESSNYYGWHLGIGRLYRFSADRDADLYAKFFYNKSGGISYDAAGAHFATDDVKSKQLHVGARMNNHHGAWNVYYGAALEYEFDGQSTGTVSVGILRSPIRASSTRGLSFMAELGWKLESTQKNPWELDFNLRGFAGCHRGVTANVDVKYMFS